MGSDMANRSFVQEQGEHTRGSSRHRLTPTSFVFGNAKMRLGPIEGSSFNSETTSRVFSCSAMFVPGEDGVRQ